MSSLEARHFVATPEDVAQITREVLTARTQIQSGRNTFLAAVIATTQAELGQHPRQRPGASGKLSQEERDKQLAALESVGKRFYEVVVKTARELIGGRDPGGRLLQKHTGFARSSLSTIRAWVRRGNDITSLVAGRTTKAMLRVPGRKRGPSVKVLSNRVQRFSRVLEADLRTFVEADRAAALEHWEHVKASLDRLFRRGSGASRRAATRAEIRPTA